MIFGSGGHSKVIEDIPLDDPDCWVVAVGDNAARKREVSACERMGRRFTVAIHPDARISPSAKIGEGSVIMAGAIVQAHAVIGRHCIINTGASVDHDCVLGDFVHIAPGAHLCGGVQVGEGAMVGVCVGVAPGYKIPPWHLVKARRITGEDIVGIPSA